MSTTPRARKVNSLTPQSSPYIPQLTTGLKCNPIHIHPDTSTGFPLTLQTLSNVSVLTAAEPALSNAFKTQSTRPSIRQYNSSSSSNSAQQLPLLNHNNFHSCSEFIFNSLMERITAFRPKEERCTSGCAHLHYVVPERVHDVDREGRCVDTAVLRWGEGWACRDSETAMV